jgi:hypothetical protein
MLSDCLSKFLVRNLIKIRLFQFAGDLIDIRITLLQYMEVIIMKRVILSIVCLLIIVQSCGKIEKSAKPKVELFPVMQNGKVGYINKLGKIVIEPKFDSAYLFHEGLAIEPQFDAATKFEDGIACVKLSKKYSYIGPQGKPIFPQEYDLAFPFSEGMARVGGDHKLGYIDKSGHPAFSAQFSQASIFSEGLAAVKVDNKWGYIDKTGKIVINPQFSDASPFQEGLASVTVGGKESGLGLLIDGKVGYIDKTGKMVVEPKFDMGRSFSEGMACVNLNGKWGFIDKTGKTVINPQFLMADGFSQGLAPVMIIKPGEEQKSSGDRGLGYGMSLPEKKSAGFVDKTGNFVIPPQFEYASQFVDGLARIYQDCQSLRGMFLQGSKQAIYFAVIPVGGKVGYIDLKGKQVWQPTK